MKSSQSILISCLFLLGGCDYLDVVPEGDLESTKTIFEKREKANKWLFSAYTTVLPLASLFQNPAFLGTDEYVTGNYMRDNEKFVGLSIADGLQMSQDPYADIWEGIHYNGIRYCNTFINNISGTHNMTTDEKLQWTAEIKALKAFLYFDLVRHYGPIVLVDENISMETPVEEMRQPRVHVDTCIQEIVRLVDEAVVDLLPDAEKDPDRRGYFCKESALMLKAKALLLAASPIFNGNEYYMNFKGKNGEPLVSMTYDAEKWRIAAEAIDKAVDACNTYGRFLYEKTNDQSTQLLNTMKNIEESVHNLSFNNPECLFAVKTAQIYNENSDDFLSKFILPAFNSATYADIHNSLSLGTLAPSVKMVEMYYTENGLPIDQDRTWDHTGRYQLNQESDPKYTDVISLGEMVLGLHLRREPRFYANIAADRCYWRIGKDEGAKKRNYVVYAYRGEQFGTGYNSIQSSNPQNISGYFLKKFLYSSLPSKTYYTGLKSQGEDPVPVMRVAELYLMQAEAWNEYAGPSKKVYDAIDVVRTRAGIPDVVTAWKSYSKSPEKVDTKEGMREIIQREYNIELAFEGQRFWNLRRWKTAHLELNDPQYGWNVIGNDAQSFYNNFNGPVIVWKKRGFVAPRDYLFPIRAQEVMISSVVQNPGW